MGSGGGAGGAWREAQCSARCQVDGRGRALDVDGRTDLVLNAALCLHLGRAGSVWGTLLEAVKVPIEVSRPSERSVL